MTVWATLQCIGGTPLVRSTIGFVISAFGLGLTRTQSPFDRADEGFSHSGVALRTFKGRRSRFKADVASEAAGITCNVAAAVVRQPLDGDRQAIDPAKPMLDGRHLQVTNVVAGDAARRGKEIVAS